METTLLGLGAALTLLGAALKMRAILRGQGPPTPTLNTLTVLVGIALNTVGVVVELGPGGLPLAGFIPLGFVLSFEACVAWNRSKAAAAT